ncbi:hypothetical protein MTQ00_09495 [Chryseobacterium sp. B21-037]|uniref:hypothetical protein n=1 Tax=Chryseobacterium sp. B21-037 TaxID=2926038 RepID=UPI002359168E|nr:hypothetical protein [Chryseobacterium sp. B21-037]MDC8104774.1 hypothetical protein [Chryseobacterium sp. B21-037]
MKILFNVDYLSKRLDTIRKNIIRRFETFPEGEILNLDQDKIIESNLKMYQVKNLSIDFTSRKADIKMVTLRRQELPPQISFSMAAGEKIDCAKVTYSYNITGDEEYFYLRPSKFYAQNKTASTIEQKKLIVHIQTYYGSESLSDKVKNEVKGIIQRFEDEVKPNLESINQEINDFNESLPKLMTELINARKLKINARKDTENDLNNF